MEAGIGPQSQRQPSQFHLRHAAGVDAAPFHGGAGHFHQRHATEFAGIAVHGVLRRGVAVHQSGRHRVAERQIGGRGTARLSGHRFRTAGGGVLGGQPVEDGAPRRVQAHAAGNQIGAEIGGQAVALRQGQNIGGPATLLGANGFDVVRAGIGRRSGGCLGGCRGGKGFGVHGGSFRVCRTIGGRWLEASLHDAGGEAGLGRGVGADHRAGIGGHGDGRNLHWLPINGPPKFALAFDLGDFVSVDPVADRDEAHRLFEDALHQIGHVGGRSQLDGGRALAAFDPG